MKQIILLCMLMSACTKVAMVPKKAPAPSITSMPVEAETVEAKNAEL